MREWLNSQVVGGYLDYHEESETYELPAEHVPVLARRGQPGVPAAGVRHPRIDVVRPGADAPRLPHGRRRPLGRARRAARVRRCRVLPERLRATLVPEWLPALDGVVEKLERGARVADIGCGHGHSTLLMAQAFERSRFVGLDTHEASIEAARANAEEAGVDRPGRLPARRRELVSAARATT